MRRLAHDVDIVSVDLIGAHFDRRDDGALPAAVGGDLVPDAAIAVEWAIDDDEHILGCLLTFGTFFETRRQPYRVVAKFRVVYEVNSEIRPDRTESTSSQTGARCSTFGPTGGNTSQAQSNRGHLPGFVAPVMAVLIPNRP